LKEKDKNIYKLNKFHKKLFYKDTNKKIDEEINIIKTKITNLKEVK
jgi:hypothetical protein